MVPLPYLVQARIPRSPPFFVCGALSNPPPSSFPGGIVPLLVPSTATAARVEFTPRRSYRAQWNLNVQRQLTRSMAFTVGYIGSAGMHLAHTFQDEDQVPAPLVTIVNSRYVFPIPAPGTKPQRINPNFGGIKATEWSG